MIAQLERGRMFCYRSINPYLSDTEILMSEMKKKKKGAENPPANNNRSDHQSSKPTSAAVNAINNSNPKKDRRVRNNLNAFIR